MSMIIFSLGILIFLSIFSVIVGESWSDFDIGIPWDAFEGRTIRGLLEDGGATFSHNELAGAIALIVIFIAIGSILGIQILGSGLSDTSVRTITLAIVYIGLWTTFSLLSANLIIGIDVFGGILYAGLTIIYAVGCVQKIGGGGED